jgi:uncharacterized protein (TIGR00297 family)
MPAIVNPKVGRAAGFGVVGTLALVAPLADRFGDPAVVTVVAPGPFLLVAVLALTTVSEGRLFELFARPGDRRDRKLYGLAGFSLAGAGLSILTVQFGLPDPVFVASVFVLTIGNLASAIAGTRRSEDTAAAAGFVVGGFLGGVGGAVSAAMLGAMAIALPLVAFLAASGALLGALLREVLFRRDDPLVMVSVGLVLWLFADLPLTVSTSRVAVALLVTIVLGYISYALETASVPGMLTGVLLGLLTIVLGDYGWFALLITFFGVGGLSSKFRYEEKAQRGIAEENEGARGSGNVLANSLVALLAVLFAAASPTHTTLAPGIFALAFAGSLAAALADTLSSEVGGLYDNPRLITSFEVVEPGTDGAITWQGELAGFAGAVLIGLIALLTFEGIGTAGLGLIVLAGVIGMTVDSVLGAVLEGWLVGNQGVNLLATFAAALAGGALALVTGFTV